MKNIFGILIAILVLIFLPGCNKSKGENEYVIKKENGKIILAYKAFENFLDSDRSWENYKSMLLDPYPQVQVVHDRQLGWGVIDSAKFPDDIKNYKREDFEHLFTQYSNETYHFLYDSVVQKAHTVLSPLGDKQVDLCFFLPYGSCFVLPEDDKNTIFISMWINPADVEKIMAHEYGHILHFDRRPEEKMTLGRELIAEGMAVYLTNRIIDNLEPENSVPFMPAKSYKWCMENEQLLKDSMKVDLNDTTEQIFTRYISDGSFAKPPKGFVQKSAYYAGYRIIEECVRKELSIEDICMMDSKTVIEKSGYFK